MPGRLSVRALLADHPAKARNLQARFARFEPEAVAQFGEDDVRRLLADAGIVRHRGKIEAAIANASATLLARERHGSLAAVVWAFEPVRRGRPVPKRLGDLPPVTPESRSLSRTLLALGFRFVGPTTAYAAMESLGLVNDHLAGCYVRAACEQDRHALGKIPVAVSL